MIKQTKRGLLVTFFWYIRGVPSTGAAAAQHRHDARRAVPDRERRDRRRRCRTSAGTCRRSSAYNNLTLVGKPVPMHTGESYDGGTALVPPVRIEDFYMTSISPAV